MTAHTARLMAPEEQSGSSVCYRRTKCIASDGEGNFWELSGENGENKDDVLSHIRKGRRRLQRMRDWRWRLAMECDDVAVSQTAAVTLRERRSNCDFSAYRIGDWEELSCWMSAACSGREAAADVIAVVDDGAVPQTAAVILQWEMGTNGRWEPVATSAPLTLVIMTIVMMEASATRPWWNRNPR